MLHFCCKLIVSESKEPDVGILRFGRSDFDPTQVGMMFGKRDFDPTQAGMMFGKRDFDGELPGMMFGKRGGLEDMNMMFGKRGLEDMNMMFGKRDFDPTQAGMMFGKRENVEDMGLMFGKRPDGQQFPYSDELYRTMFRTMHGKRDMTLQELQGISFFSIAH